MMRLLGLLLLGCCVAQAGEWQGRPVAELLDALRASGVEVLYSSDLVPASMMIEREPHGTLLDGARETLAGAGLLLQPIGPGHHVVTRARPPATAPAAPAQAAQLRELQQVDVYASRYALQSRDAGRPYDLASADIEQVPAATNDPMRAALGLPGLASGLSARPYVRGSLQDDVLVRFDGVALADPFHLKNFQSLVSAFDPSLIEQMELYSGGFPVRYGTRSGGVINLTPKAIAAGHQYEIGASGLTVQASTVGNDPAQGLEWLAGARTSIVDLVLDPLQRNLGDPNFSDLLTRVRWQAGERSAWVAGVLALDDRLQLQSDASTKQANAKYRDAYGWLAFEHTFSQQWQARSVFSVTRSDRRRDAQVNEPDIAIGTVQTQQNFAGYAFSSDWRYSSAEHASWDLGMNYQWVGGAAHYSRALRFPAPIAALFGRGATDDLTYAADPSQASYALYAAVHPWQGARLQSEFGLRLDGQREVSGAHNAQWSPRINLRYRLLPRVDVYGSWGRFTQAQRPDEWSIEQGQTTAQPAQIATHAILGLLYRPER
ncbi:MAG TPA: TonB-dependent receptor, partial [Steroidobacteraceae bacterium]